MKKWLFFVLIISFSIYAQGDDLETNLDQTLDQMQENGEILEDNPPAEDDMATASAEETNGSSTMNSDPSIGGKDEGIFDRMLDKVKAKFIEQVASNPFKNLSAVQVRNIVYERTAGTTVGDVLKESPRIMYFIVNFLRDEFAINDLMGVFKREKDLKLYSYIAIGVTVFFFLLGWYYDRKLRSGFFKTVLRKLFFIFLTSVISLAVFYAMFYKEVKPTVGIIQEAVMKPMVDLDKPEST